MGSAAPAMAQEISCASTQELKQAIMDLSKEDRSKVAACIASQGTAPLTVPSSEDVAKLVKATPATACGLLDVVLTGRANSCGGKEYRLEAKPLPEGMLAARSSPDAKSSEALEFLQKLKVQNYGVLGQNKAGEGPGWKANTAILDAAGFAPVQGLMTQGASDGKWGLGRLKFAARAVAEAIHGQDLPEAYPGEISEQLVSPGAAGSWVYDGKAGAFEGEKVVVHAIGMNYDLSKAHYGFPTVVNADEASATAIQAFTYANVMKQCLALMKSHTPAIHTWRLLPLSGGSYAGDFAKAMPKITCEAIYAAIRSLSQQEKATLLTSECCFELCLYTEEEHSAYSEALKVFMQAAASAEPTVGPSETPPETAAKDCPAKQQASSS
eukprot:gb/GFBE01054655.1/.p1 GENE.gb/GFBE01054655.1/~~gb/GFBE01054655.1/.p1  ORF type:complete len:382 (+),score=98.09 gb/GFBE01054655.1/:1-1146(+)